MADYADRLDTVRLALRALFPLKGTSINAKKLPTEARQGLEAALDLVYFITPEDRKKLAVYRIEVPDSLFKDRNDCATLTARMISPDEYRASKFTKQHIQAGLDACLFYCKVVEKASQRFLDQKRIALMKYKVTKI